MNNRIIDVDILDESSNCFLDYSREVLADRAIPSAQDGLLSAHRKILWTMESPLKMTSASPFKKSASIVGTTLATSYFHGDASCYGALCKLSLPFLMRYNLIEGKGSLGTQESNDMQAASRYTNARPSKYADLMFEDFKKDSVDLQPTYNNEYKEPVVLPSLLPNAICNGRQAIGVSMAHNSLPHNLTEVCEGIVAYIKNNDITVKELMQYIKGPDFPLGGVVINSKDIYSAFETGHSAVSLKVRGDCVVEGDKIIFTTIPYRVTRSAIREQISKHIDEIAKYIEDFDDESGVGKNKLVFKVKKGVDIKDALAVLYQYTDLQTTLSYNMNFIVNGTPKMCSMKDLVVEYVNHQIDVLIRVAKYDKDKAEKRLIIILGLLIALKNIDDFIHIIRNSNTKKEAEEIIIKKYSLNEDQVDAVLKMPLQRLTRMDKEKLLKEKEEKEAIIIECKKIINDSDYRDSILIKKVEKMKKEYGDERRTILTDIEFKVAKKKKETVPNTEVYISRTSAGIKLSKRKMSQTQTTKLNSTLLFFTNLGNCYKLPVVKLKETLETYKDLLGLKDGEVVLNVTDFEQKGLVYQTTRFGMVKKTKIEDFLSSRPAQSIKLKETDEVIAVDFGNYSTVVQETDKKVLSFSIDEIAVTGRAGLGVKGIKLKDDEVVIKAIFNGEEPTGKRGQVGKVK